MTGSSSGPERLGEGLLALVWRFGMEWYGGLWVTAYGKTPTTAWSFGLAGLDLGHLERGFRALRDRDERHPPSLPEFRALCLPPEDRRPAEQRAMYARIERATETTPALEHRPIASDTARRWVAFNVLEGTLAEGYGGMTREAARELLSTFEVEQMREQVSRHAEQITSGRAPR